MKPTSPLAEFEIHVMLAVARLGPGAYGARIRQEIEARARRRVSIGAVYATLGRLEDRGLLTHAIAEPLPVQGGRSRKVYTATPEGRTALETATGMLLRMMEGLELGRSGGS